jgi:hypothetical protein
VDVIHDAGDSLEKKGSCPGSPSTAGKVCGNNMFKSNNFSRALLGVNTHKFAIFLDLVERDIGGIKVRHLRLNCMIIFHKE